MKFSTLAALMATTTAVKIDQTIAVKAAGTLATKIKAKTTESEPHYEIEGIMKLVGNSTASHHEGPDLNDEMAEADTSRSVSAATPHNPMHDVSMSDQKFRVGGQLDVMLNPAPMGGFFYIDLLIDHGRWLYVTMYGKDAGYHAGCISIEDSSNANWEYVEYCVKEEAGESIDELFEYGPEFQVKFLENGIDLRVFGHLINEEMSDIFEIYGNKGKNTFTSSNPISWGEFNMVDVYHGYGPHIIEVAMEY